MGFGLDSPLYDLLDQREDEASVKARKLAAISELEQFLETKLGKEVAERVQEGARRIAKKGGTFKDYVIYRHKIQIPVRKEIWPDERRYFKYQEETPKHKRIAKREMISGSTMLLGLLGGFALSIYLTRESLSNHVVNAENFWPHAFMIITGLVGAALGHHAGKRVYETYISIKHRSRFKREIDDYGFWT